MSDELEELRKKRMVELQQNAIKQQQAQATAEQQAMQQVAQLETLVKQFLTREALERYGNLKIAHPEKAMNVLGALGQLVSSGRIRQQITDDQFRQILQKLEPEKKDFKIRRI